MSLVLNSEKQRELVLQNQKLVYYLVKQLNVVHNNFEDMVSIGTIGLIKAAASYDYEKDIRFATYATRCIKNEIFMYFRKENMRANDISLEASLSVDSDGNELTLSEIVASPGDFTEELASDEIFENFINIVLNCLTKKERLIMLYRIANVNQQEIANEINISQSYISRLEKALAKKITTYLKGKTEFKGVFTMTKVKDSYQISFSSNDVKKFNKIFSIFLEKISLSKEISDFKVISSNGRIWILIPADPEAFSVIADIVKIVDDYSVEVETKK